MEEKTKSRLIGLMLCLCVILLIMVVAWSSYMEGANSIRGLGKSCTVKNQTAMYFIMPNGHVLFGCSGNKTVILGDSE